MGRWQTLHVLRDALRTSAIRRILLAFLLFRTGETATWTALLIWAFAEGGAAATASIALAQLVPATIVAPLGSVLSDRMARPRALRLGYLLQAVATLATAILLFLDAPYLVILVIAGVMASTMTLTRPVHHALVPEIARTPDELTAGNTASSGVQGLADLLGPALAGGLLFLTRGQAGWVFLLAAAASLVAALVTRNLVVVQRARAPSRSTYRSDAVEGLQTLISVGAARVLTMVSTGRYVLVGLLEVLAVVFALELLRTGPAGPGLITSALGAGALVGAAVSVTLIGRRRLVPALGVGILVTSIPVAVVAATSTFAAVVLLFGLAGVGRAYVGVAARTLLQRSVTPHVLARLFGIQEALLMAGTAAGAAAAPVLVALFGLRGAFVAASFLLPVLGLLGLRQLRRLDRRPAPPPATVELLRGIPMFGVLPQPELEMVADSAVPLPLRPAGEEVITQGDEGETYYVIVDGGAEVLKQERVVASLGPGEGFGEIALLRAVPRTATVRTTEPTRLLAVHRQPFLVAVTGTEASFATVDASIDDMLEDDADTA